MEVLMQLGSPCCLCTVEPLLRLPQHPLPLPHRQQRILDWHYGRFGLVDVPRAEVDFEAEEIAVHRLLVGRVPRDVQRCARRVVRGGDARLSRRLCDRKGVNDF